MTALAMLQAVVQGAGAHQWGVVAAGDIPFSGAVREACEQNVCRRYGTTWACPPAVGTVEQCRARCLEYDCLLVFTGLYRLEDSFDFEGMQAGHADFQAMCGRVAGGIKAQSGGGAYPVLTNEGCARCAACTWPELPCRFPEQLQHSIEGYGILVSELAKKARVNYINGPNTVTYFGGVLFKQA